MLTKTRPEKPRPDFPLYVHGSGQWARTICGRKHYFGAWADPTAAEAEFNRCRADLESGRPRPPKPTGALTVQDACNHFLLAKKTQLQAGSLSQRSLLDYHAVCSQVVEFFGGGQCVEYLNPQSFTAFLGHLSKSKSNRVQSRGLHIIGRIVTTTKMIFEFAYQSNLIEQQVRFGPLFKKPARQQMRIDRAKKQKSNGLKMFEAVDLKKILKHASTQMKAMILLGVNCGLGNTDIATLTQDAIRGGWLDFPRQKTGISRRVPLWPETVKAIDKAIADRPVPKSDDDSRLIFVTKYGHRWVRIGKSGTSNLDKIADEFKKLLQDLNMKRPGIGFYGLRHTFETVGGGCGDQIAVSAIMGHVDGSMSGIYRESIEDRRLIACTDYVRRWLFG